MGRNGPPAFQRRLLGVAADVADNTAKPSAPALKRAPRSLELMRMGIAPDHDGGALGNTQLALAQLHILALCKIDQLLDRAIPEVGIGRMRDRLSFGALLQILHYESGFLGWALSNER